MHQLFGRPHVARILSTKEVRDARSWPGPDLSSRSSEAGASCACRRLGMGCCSYRNNSRLVCTTFVNILKVPTWCFVTGPCKSCFCRTMWCQLVQHRRRDVVTCRLLKHWLVRRTGSKKNVYSIIGCQTYLWLTRGFSSIKKDLHILGLRSALPFFASVLAGIPDRLRNSCGSLTPRNKSGSRSKV